MVNGPLGKINIMLYVLNFKKAVAHMSICLYEFSAHQIFRLKLPTLRFLEKKMNVTLQNNLNDPEHFDLATTFQVHPQSRIF